MSDREVPDRDASKHEPTLAAATRRLTAILAALGATIGGSLIISRFVYELGVGSPPGQLLYPPTPQFPEPQLKVNPSTDLTRFQANQQAQLHEKAALPIDQAMARIAARGAAAYGPLKEQKP